MLHVLMLAARRIAAATQVFGAAVRAAAAVEAKRTPLKSDLAILGIGEKLPVI
ncbi:hypothetical protein GCM10007276_26530 [Agaricicola taiwanensis]|uniref:Uncharacterized protein n=1 Tax=Agaricicola taiwanensis TaxID=591372 RepID=A0A8J2YJE2_9RHOB|nr:hypothetical protein [Agaricicola taiwanensis]GGE47970.1 hypothetical protein GCM10007276_26530 [Agaricicola taiwanensis]